MRTCWPSPAPPGTAGSPPSSGPITCWPWATAAGLPGPSESFVNLGAIAAQVPDIRLGTLVTSATFRHPSMTAIAVAQIDDISGGRMELGLGSGWFEAEHTRLRASTSAPRSANGSTG